MRFPFASIESPAERDDVETIAEVAQRVGFSDQSYFDRKFKQYFQRLPKEGRNGN